jgi:hypothetical protein
MLVYCSLAWFVTPALTLAAPFVVAAFVLYHPDLKNFSGFEALILSKRGGAELLKQVPIKLLVLLQIPLALIAPLINCSLCIWGRMGLAWIPVINATPDRTVVCAGFLWNHLGTLARADRLARLRLSTSPKARRCAYGAVLRYNRNPPRLAEAANRHHLVIGGGTRCLEWLSWLC